MSRQHTPSLQLETSHTTVKRNTASASAHSSASDEQYTSSNPTRRRKHSSMSPNTTNNTSRPRESTRQRQKAKTTSQKGGQGAGRGSIMMPGSLSQGEEITYTPTTHRISKAKKGKKVHACEYPGCTKIFTRAEHRKRHEANHNASPAFQCDIEGCRKPFQRADLLARHMERQHNMPSAETSSFRSQYRQGSTSDVSSPSRGSISGPHTSQSASATAPSLTQSSGTMSIGSIIEPTMQQRSGDFKSEYSSHSGPSLHELPHTGPIGTAPRNLAPEILYGFSPSCGDSPFYTSSSDSCYSPLSGISSDQNYLQPSHTVVPRPYYLQEIIPQRSQSTGIECFQPIVSQSPLSAGPGTPSWNQYDPSSLGFATEPQSMPPHPRFQFHSPSWPGANIMPPYAMNHHPQPPMSWARANDLAY